MTRILLICLLTLTYSIEAYAEEYWANEDRVARRTCPSANCGVVGDLFFREKVTVFEKKNNWIRSTKPYPAFCENGIAKFVKRGNQSCTEENGIINGNHAEWVYIGSLSNTEPIDPAIDATGDYLLIKGSDDYRTYKDSFVKAAQNLINHDKCTRDDFILMGGWLKSISQKNKPIYFTICGDVQYRLNAQTGETWKQ
jgi:hypothetical protein